MLCESLIKNERLVTACNSVGGIGAVAVVAMVLQIALIFLGKYLWNKYLVSAISFINPLTSVIDLLAIMFIAKLVFA